MASGKIVELMRMPVEQHDLDWLKQSLQAAVELEFATIPTYLSGMWSIKVQSGEVYNLINSVVLEEMLHMGLACNMLTAIGGQPQIVAPTYPGGLPGGVRPELEVYLAGLSSATVEMYMQIETPETPVAAAADAETFPTLGAFYDAISAAFATLSPPLSATGQIETTIGVPDPDDPGGSGELTEPLPILATIADVQAAIATIKDQGEGTSTSPDAPQFDGGELAHYYRFGEILNAKQLVQVDGKWEFTGPAVPFPDCYPVARIPDGGYPDVPAVQAFDAQYAQLIGLLESAWSGGGVSVLETAIGVMLGLYTTYVLPLVQTPLPDGGGNFGPDFLPTPGTPAPSPAAPTGTTTTTTSTTTAGALTVSFAADIVPMFTTMDVDHMQALGVSLTDYAYMSQPANAQAVLSAVSQGTMPPSSSGEARWTPAQVASFQAWIDGGFQK
jgi:hypothetical protein